MFRNMVTSLLSNERITTTDAKAKELRSIADKMITLGKKGDLHAMRQAASYIRDKKVVTKLFTTIAPRYAERPGGYTRIIKLGVRLGDNAPVSVIELVEEQFEKKTGKKPVVKKAKEMTAAKSDKAPKEEPVVEAAPEAKSAVADASVQSVVIEGDEACEAKSD